MMNQLKLIFLFIVVSSLSASALQDIAKDQQLDGLKALQQKIVNEFDALPIPKRLQYLQYKKKAQKAIQDGKYLTCLVGISDAQSIFKSDLELLFINGLCQAELQNVDEAIACYEKVLEINPNHTFTLLNLVEINYFAGRYEEVVKCFIQVNPVMSNQAKRKYLPLLEFKRLIAMTKLSKLDPLKYRKQMERVRKKYTFMDDNPFYYYVKALELFDRGDRRAGLSWIMKAYSVFGKPGLIDVWNKSLVNAGFISTHEIMFVRVERK